MKKLILSLIAGAVFIGIGAGVLFLELSEFTMTDYLPYIQTEKRDSFSFSDSEIFGKDNSTEAEIDLYLGNYFYDSGKVKLVEDETVEGVDVKIIYRGEKPHFYFHNSWYNEDENRSSYRLSCFAENYMPKDILDAAKYVFENKVLVKDFSNFRVEEIIITTSHPELIKTSF